MSISSEINEKLDQCFTVLILDNEVPLDAFVTEPALKWLRLVNSGGAYTTPHQYPTRLTKQESDREEMNWDKVDLDHLQAEMAGLDNSIDLIAIGNNARAINIPWPRVSKFLAPRKTYSKYPAPSQKRQRGDWACLYQHN